ncbi:uncharacterized protein C3orf38 homolog [Haematobia irritans]|uniref:uncharacterized protein C3orf38 homolog n=1 Tax=Haematobia irritans TaxID=7368 RepID=UPI003F504673
MMPFSTSEKNGIIDLLDPHILIQIARSVTKNVVDITTADDALEYIFTHTSDIQTLLNKKAITKEILFKYLHSKRVSLESNFTKAVLVNRVIEYWKASEDLTKEETDATNQCGTSRSYESHHNGNSNVLNQGYDSSIASPASEPDFPINLLARKFSEWFFNNYNQHTLKLNDFWQDVRLIMEITASDGSDIQDCDNALSTLEVLYGEQERFGFFFNPNLSHSGVQGRMDVHGLVLVLACGTLHTQQACVGIFECIFGLLRDPFCENNWKTKNIKLILRSKGVTSTPSLLESDTLHEALALPVPEGDLT